MYRPLKNIVWERWSKGSISQFHGENLSSFYKSIGLAGHPGTDLAVSNGASVYSMRGGVVKTSKLASQGIEIGDITSNNENPYGNRVRVWSDPINGVIYDTIYAHLGTLLVREGERVVAGQLIAYSDNTGNSTGPHLHVATRKRNPASKEVLNYGNGYLGYYDNIEEIRQALEPGVEPEEVTEDVIEAVKLASNEWNMFLRAWHAFLKKIGYN